MSDLSEAMVTAGALAAIRASETLGALADKPEIEKVTRAVLAAALRVLVDEADRREAIVVTVPSLTRIANSVEHPAEDDKARIANRVAGFDPDLWTEGQQIVEDRR